MWKMGIWRVSDCNLVPERGKSALSNAEKDFLARLRLQLSPQQ